MINLGRGVSTGVKAVNRLTRWRSVLGLLAILITLMTTAAEAAQPNQSTGTSFFDQLFHAAPSSDSEPQQIPYPFETLLAVLRERIPTTHGARSTPYSTVLIPRGRSLQRDAARPDWFRYPRIVVAVDAESRRRVPSKDRLFIGYQEKAEQLEVISYNEVAGRFEFQVVEDYARGKQPIVKQANRALCLSCHQNGATIFPRFGWSETNFDRGVAERIGAKMTQFHGVGTSSDAGEAGRIDAATDRANFFSSYQRVWQQGCGAGSDAGRRCRAGLFQAMLLHRLLGPSFAFNDHKIQRDRHYRTLLRQSWQARWPNGIEVPTADIPDRRANFVSTPAGLPAYLDPLSSRAPRAHWHADKDLDRIIGGMADTFLLKTDIDRLDQALQRRSLMSKRITNTVSGDCRFSHASGSVDNTWVEIGCAVSGGGDSAELIAELFIDDDGRVHRELSWLYLVDDRIYDPASLSGTVASTVNELQVARLRLTKRNDTLRARNWSGAAMSTIVFAWNDPVVFNSDDGGTFNGQVTLQLSNDLGLIDKAVAALLEDARTGDFDGFDAHPIRGTALMAALFDKMGITYPSTAKEPPVSAAGGTAAVVEHTDMPITDMIHEGATPSATASEPARQLLTRYCGACHRSSAQLPPGFLLGDAEQVTANLRQCAERIRYRLTMWQTNAEGRTKTPMPPPSFINEAIIDAQNWPTSRDYRTLLAYVESLRDSPRETASHSTYIELPPCL